MYIHIPRKLPKVPCSHYVSWKSRIFHWCIIVSVKGKMRDTWWSLTHSSSEILWVIQVWSCCLISLIWPWFCSPGETHLFFVAYSPGSVLWVYPLSITFSDLIWSQWWGVRPPWQLCRPCKPCPSHLSLESRIWLDVRLRAQSLHCLGWLGY